MKRLTILFAVLVVFLWVGSAMALPTVVQDNYWGADDHTFGDVIGDTSSFGIDRAEISLSGNILSVAIYSNFAGHGDDGSFSSSTNTSYGQRKGIGYGDLFLSSSWDPFETAPYAGDNNSTGTLWKYGFALDNRWWDGNANDSDGNTGGTGTLYKLEGTTNAANALMTDDFMSGATYRNGQEVAVDTDSNTVSALQNSVSWTIDETNGIITFLIDTDGTGLLQGNEIAFHWGMTCANDVIEGAAPVPEPATMLLFGTGLIGLAAVGRKKFKIAHS